MALNHVPAEAAIGTHWTFQVDDRSGAQVLQACSIECLARKLGSEAAFVVLANCKTDAIYRDTRAGGHTFENSVGSDAKRSKLATVVYRDDFADFFNDSGEHKR